MSVDALSSTAEQIPVISISDEEIERAFNEGDLVAVDALLGQHSLEQTVHIDEAMVDRSLVVSNDKRSLRVCQILFQGNMYAIKQRNLEWMLNRTLADDSGTFAPIAAARAKIYQQLQDQMRRTS